MPWYKVVIDSGNAFLKERTGREFLETFRRMYHDFLAETTDIPHNAEIYHIKDKLDNHIYYVSPTAASPVEKLLRSYNATPYAEQPALEGFQKVVDL